MKKTCRLCYDSQGPMMTPCECTGSIAHVHLSCLLQWIVAKPKAKDACELCKAPYTGIPDELETTRVPLLDLMSHPEVPLFVWSCLCVWFSLLGNTNVTPDDLMKAVALLHSSLPYSLLCMTVVYAAIATHTFCAVKRKHEYIQFLRFVEVGNRYVRLGPASHGCLCVFALGMSVVYPLPGCLLYGSLVSSLPAIHIAIVRKMNEDFPFVENRRLR